jgi:putative Holliday junction resolvase
MCLLEAKKIGPSQAAVEKASRILAVDYGRKRIGLALSDELGLTAQPLTVMVRKNREADLKRLREICARHDVRHVIVGHPVHITGEESEMAGEAARFAARLAKALNIETEMIDERLTSWQAKQTLAETNGRGSKRASVDDVAAAVLLRDYLEHRRESAISARERD